MDSRLIHVTVISIATGITLSCLFFWLFYKMETKNIQREFEDDVEVKASALYQKINFHLEALYSVKSTFDKSGVLSSSEFSDLVAQTLTRHKKIHALGWIPKVDHSARDEMEAPGRENRPGFQITERVATGEMVRASDRDVYYPVYYVEPVAGNHAVIGYDLGSNALRREAINRARDSGQLQLSGGVKLVQAAGEQSGLLSFIPVYNTEAPQALQQRQNTIVGFVVAVFNFDEIFNVAYVVGDERNMTLMLIDTTASKGNHQLFKQPQNNSGDNGLLKPFLYSQTVLDMGGRRWVLNAIPTEYYFSERRTTMPWLVLIGGNLFFAFATLFGFIILRRNKAINRDIDIKNQELNAANARLDRLTKTDGLTGISNRRCFDEYLDQEFRRAARESKPIALLLIDIDYFKAFNDNYGHQAGDRCLTLVATELERTLKRPADMIARIGGEEFGVLLPNTTNGEVVAKQCKAVLERLAIEHKASDVYPFVTISIGVVSAVSVANQTIESLFNTADAALYQAKKGGRNRVRAIKINGEVPKELVSLC